MKAKIIVLPLAELDILESIDFYKRKSQITVIQFIESLDYSIIAIQENPKSYPIVKTEIRKYTMKKFPFCIYFIERVDVIYILAVFHSKRNPTIWEERKIRQR